MKTPRTLRPSEYRDFLGRSATVPNSVALPSSEVLGRYSLRHHLRGLVWSLKRYFEIDPRILVGFELPIRPDPNSNQILEPSFFVSRGVRDFPRGKASYDLGAWPAPDFVFETHVEAPRREECVRRAEEYFALGVADCFFYFPGKPDFACFDAYRRKNGETRRVGAWMKQWHATSLNLDFGAPSGYPVAVDARAGVVLPTPIQLMARRFSDEQRV